MVKSWSQDICTRSRYGAPRLRCRQTVCSGTLPNSVKETKAQENSVHFLKREQEFPEGWLQGSNFKSVTNEE